MKQTAVLCAAIFLLAAGAHAQAISGNPLPAAPAAVTAAPAATTDSTPLYAANAAPATSDSSASAISSTVASDASSKSGDPQQPAVYSVFQTYNWQATAGYSFFRFYVVPGLTVNTNGLNLGLAWYPGGKWVAGEGQIIGTFGSVFGESARYVQAMGGPRFRWSAPHGLEIWGHGLVGRAHEHPQTIFGNQGAFAYEVGGGVDFNVHQKRYALRAGADMIGTRFFNTYQYSPEVSIGFVFKF